MYMVMGGLEKELEEEIRELELNKARYDAQLEEKRSLLSRLRQSVAVAEEPAPPAPAPIAPVRADTGTGGGRKSISAILGKHHYEIDGRRFKNPGHVLDHFDAPHYFSRQYPQKGDIAVREILRWAKRNPAVAGRVSVVLPDGSRMRLDKAVSAVSPDG